MQYILVITDKPFVRWEIYEINMAIVYYTKNTIQDKASHDEQSPVHLFQDITPVCLARAKIWLATAATSAA